MKRLIPIAALAMAAQIAAASELDAARLVFRAAISKAYGISEKRITVQPAHPGTPDNPYDPLKTGALFAFRADWKEADPGPGGFAAADGRSAFAKAPNGLKELLIACNAADAEKSLPLPALIKRIHWCIRGFGEPLEYLDLKHSVTRAQGKTTIVFHARRDGGTGSFLWTKVTVSFLSDSTTTYKSETIRPTLP